MIENLERTYAEMPAAKRGECTDRATVRALIEWAPSGTACEEGIIVRAPSRRLSTKIRRSRRATQKSLDRLERDGYGRRVEEPAEKIDKRGQAFLLYPSQGGGSAESSHYRGEDGGSEGRTHDNTDTYAYSYATGYSTRSPDVPELRAPKVVHTWERKEGRRVVADSAYFFRLDKPRQEVLMYLLERGGVSEEELLGRFGSKSTRLRDFRRRRLAPLLGYRFRRDPETKVEERLETGPPIIALEGGMVSLLSEWRVALEEHRASTDEDGDTRRQAERYRLQSKGYRARDKTPADEQPNPLLGKERVRRASRARDEEDRERWVEEMRRKVGLTPWTFLAEEMEEVCYVRFWDIRDRWERHGGLEADLKRAVLYGPYVFRKVEGDLYVDHRDGRTEDYYDRKVKAVMARMEDQERSAALA
jgi:hypothetical protein